MEKWNYRYYYKTLHKMIELDGEWDKKWNNVGEFPHFPHLSIASPLFPLVPLMNSASRTSWLEK